MYHRTKCNVVVAVRYFGREFHSRVMQDYLFLKSYDFWFTYHSLREKMSSIKRFQTVGLKTVLVKLCLLLYAMEMMERKLLSLCSS